MKITADGILGSAKQLNKQRELSKSSKGNSSGKTSDRVEIENKIDSRLDTIQRDLKVIQSSLTKNQVVKDGLNQLVENKYNSEDLYKQFIYNDERVLEDFLGKEANLGEELVKEKFQENNQNILQDTRKIKELEVATENIYAANIVPGDKVEKILGNINELFAGEKSNMNGIANLNADKVMRLIR